MRGDAGDGIPNVLSKDDTFMSGGKQTPLRQTRIDEWLENGHDLKATMPEDLYRNYQRNKTLIDLNEIPQHIQESIINKYDGTETYVHVEPGKGMGLWITEAPRGMLIHKYEFDRRGAVTSARIIPPTSQNLAYIENNLREYINRNSAMAMKDLRRGCEQIIRSYDPCISCSVHLIDLSQ